MDQTPHDRPRESSCTGDNSKYATQTIPLGSATDKQPAGGPRVLNPATRAPENAIDRAASRDDTTEEEDDFTIREYVAQLIARSQHSEQDRKQPPSPPLLAEPTAPSETTVLGDKPAEAEPPRQEQEPGSQLTPARPPECRNSISELRELANIDARSSLNTHRVSQLIYKMHEKLAVALVALVVSFCLLATTSFTSSFNYVSAIIASIIALYWGATYFRLARQLRQICFPRQEKEP